MDQPQDDTANNFEQTPVPTVLWDYTPLHALGEELDKQTVTQYYQYLTEFPELVKKTFSSFKLLAANKAAHELFQVAGKDKLEEYLKEVLTTSAVDLLVQQFSGVLKDQNDFSGEFEYKSQKKSRQDILLQTAVAPPQAGSKVLIACMALINVSVYKNIERLLLQEAQLDGLTKLYNHTTIARRLENEVERAKRYGLSFSCMMIDLDHFKVINDHFGHQNGDKILLKSAEMIQKCVRNVDLVGRYGGDEFLLIMPETKVKDAGIAADRIHKTFQENKFEVPGRSPFQMTVSIGLAGYPSKAVNAGKDIIALADKAMYDAKKAGRNQIAYSE